MTFPSYSPFIKDTREIVRERTMNAIKTCIYIKSLYLDTIFILWPHTTQPLKCDDILPIAHMTAYFFLERQNLYCVYRMLFVSCRKISGLSSRPITPRRRFVIVFIVCFLSLAGRYPASV